MNQNTYEVQWLVPAENAIGNVSYWQPLHLSNGKTQTEDRAQAEADLKTAQTNFSMDTVRLVEVSRQVINPKALHPNNWHRISTLELTFDAMRYLSTHQSFAGLYHCRSCRLISWKREKKLFDEPCPACPRCQSGDLAIGEIDEPSL